MFSLPFSSHLESECIKRSRWQLRTWLLSIMKEEPLLTPWKRYSERSSCDQPHQDHRHRLRQYFKLTITEVIGYSVLKTLQHINRVFGPDVTIMIETWSDFMNNYSNLSTRGAPCPIYAAQISEKIHCSIYGNSKSLLLLEFSKLFILTCTIVMHRSTKSDYYDCHTYVSTRLPVLFISIMSGNEHFWY